MSFHVNLGEGIALLGIWQRVVRKPKYGYQHEVYLRLVLGRSPFTVTATTKDYFRYTTALLLCSSSGTVL